MKRAILFIVVFLLIFASVSCNVQEIKGQNSIKSAWSSSANGFQTYANLGGDSGVHSYEYDENYIKVRFNGPGTKLYTYVYTYDSAGPEKIEVMKKLADTGKGLNTYIRAKVYKLYEWTDYVKVGDR
jgi:hypothetical protein